ncbi:MAG TPA: AAA family ATPase [Acidobacteriaceae bacterium]|jgi:predicted ATPase|nr:AAA family ATPase [Vicinamibacterales bacterium]HVT99796.1 AAA family ATPase [Acidobacteriaceae bacterium]
MRISRLTIAGFRGVSQADLRLGSHSILVGPNNVGKTTVIEAIALLFGRDRLVRELTEHDFFGSAPDQRSRITTVATLTDFEADDQTRHREWFGAERGIAVWLAPDGTLHPARTDPTWKLAVQIGFCARFNVDTLEAETIRFFVDDEADIGDPFDEENTVRPVRGKALQELGFFLVSATRTWDRWISFTSELFRKVIAATGEVPAEAVRAERGRVWNPAERLENAAGISGIVANINRELTHLMSAPPELQLRLTSTDSAGVLQAVVPHFQQGASTPTLPAARQGSGLASLQSLLLLMQFGAARKDKGQCFILGVEEPELHVPPSQQKRLVNRLNAVCTQTVMTTHSPLVASMFPPEDVIFMRNVGGTLSGSPLSLGNAAPSNHEQHLFYGWRNRLVAALMHEYVLVPEGVSDVAWLDALQTAIELRQDWKGVGNEPTRFGTFVGVAPTADAKVAETYTVAKRVHSDVVCLVDGDPAGLGYVAALKALTPPPKVVFVWPDGWTTENVVGWIADAKRAVALSQLGTALGATFGNGAVLKTHLERHKTYLPLHECAAEVLAGIPECRARTSDLLNDMADVVRGASGPRKHLVPWPQQSTATTSVWRLKP